jgi:glycosyltransferase involved in cell wall biosynthesis
MNILFIAPEIPYPLTGGHPLRTFNILKLLAENNKIYFVSFIKEEDEIKYKIGIEPICETIDLFYIQKDDFSMRFLLNVFKNIFSPLPFVAQKYFSKKAFSRILEILSKYQIDLIHLDLLPMSSYYPALDSVPTILTDHNVESQRLYRWMKIEKNIFTKLFLFYQHLKLRRYEREMCARFDLCIAVSDEDKNQLHALCKTGKFEVIPNGVDIDYYAPSDQIADKNRCIWVGGMDGPYNSDAVDYFLDEIFPLVKKELPQVEIDFVGRFPTKKLTKKAAEEKKIKVYGFVDDVRPYIHQAAVFIAPIRSGSGTKIKVLNAMSLGKPVVTTSIGAEGILAEPDHDVMIADDPRNFADKIIYLLRNPDKAKDMGRKARKLIEEVYDWEVIRRKMEKLYQDIYMTNGGRRAAKHELQQLSV